MERSDLVNGMLTLAEIERRLRALGHSQAEIDAALALVIDTRQHLAVTGRLPHVEWRLH